jgi:F-type H+-transporting ATPase subunit a
VAAPNAGTEGTGMPDPIHQFEIHRIIPIKIFGWDASFTNASLFMLLAVVLIAGFFVVSMQTRSLVPSRLQSLAEVSYEFVANMLRESVGHAGMKYFPFVFTIFIFVFTANTLGLIPGFFTVTSHIVVTAALAAMVFLTVLVVGFAKNGVKFLQLFVPQGVPIRLFANMLAGHITLKVFGGFVVMLLSAGTYAALAPLPLVMAIALTALEVLVAFLQAYVFTMLTCMYLNDALHPGH